MRDKKAKLEWHRSCKLWRKHRLRAFYRVCYKILTKSGTLHKLEWVNKCVWVGCVHKKPSQRHCCVTTCTKTKSQLCYYSLSTPWISHLKFLLIMNFGTTLVLVAPTTTTMKKKKKQNFHGLFFNPELVSWLVSYPAAAVILWSIC